jgi:hypothetical protein
MTMPSKWKQIGFGIAILYSLALVELVLTNSLAQTPSPPDAGKGGPPAPKAPLSSGETMLKLLGVREVREEIALTDEQDRKLRLRGEEIREDVEATLRKLVDEALEEVLSSSQISRLKEITTQLLGVEALIDPAIAKKLNLSIGQVRQLKAIRFNAISDIEDAKHIFKGKEGEADRFLIEDEIRITLPEKMLRVLTQQQRKAFEEMQGMRFSAPHIPGVSPKGPKEQKGPKEPKGPKKE